MGGKGSVPKEEHKDFFKDVSQFRRRNRYLPRLPPCPWMTGWQVSLTNEDQTDDAVLKLCFEQRSGHGDAAARID